MLAAACVLALEVTNISDRVRQDRAIAEYVAGAVVRVVRINSPAARAGVRVGDVIQGVDDQLIQNVCGYERALAKHGCIGDVRLTVRRGNATIALDVPLSRPPKASPHFDDQQACQSGVPDACTRLGWQHKQIDLFRLGCDLGDAEGCYLFAVNAGDGNAYTREAYRQACDGGNSLACTNLGWMLQYGKGGRVDLEESVAMYRRGCQGSACSPPNNVGCNDLARMLLHGVGAPADPAEARRIFREVCDRKPLNDEDAREIEAACSAARQ